MKILELTVVGPRKASAVLRTKNGVSHYNIKHGVFAQGFWEYTMGVSDSIPTNFDNNELPLDLNYRLVPVLDPRTNEQLQDRKNNDLYYIIKSNDIETMDDTLVLWTLPTTKYFNIKYTISGECEVLGKGINISKLKDKVEAPIILVRGSVILRWYGKDENDVSYSQKITISKGEVNISEVIEYNS